MKCKKAAAIAAFAVTALLTTSPSLRATQLDPAVRENEAVVTQLSADATAVSYWTSAPEGWSVVTTVDTVTSRDADAEQHAVVRFSATLAPGQAQAISVPAPLGTRPLWLRIQRLGDRIVIERMVDDGI